MNAHQIATAIATNVIANKQQMRADIKDGDSVHIAVDYAAFCDRDGTEKALIAYLCGEDKGQDVWEGIDYYRLSRARSVASTVKWLAAEIESAKTCN